MNATTRTGVLPASRLNGTETPVGAWLEHRSEGVRKARHGTRSAEKVLGVGSLAKFMRVTFGELAEILAQYTGGRVYRKSTLCTWASVERNGRIPAGWYARYWMPHDVELAFKQLIRDLVRVVSRGRMRARVSGVHRWRVEVVRVGGK